MNLNVRHSEPSRFDNTVVHYGIPPASVPKELTSSSLLAAVRRTGTSHIFGDTADVQELSALASNPNAFFREIDGNTVNQPLVNKVIGRYLAGNEPALWARRLRSLHPTLTTQECTVLIYTIICGRIGNDSDGAFSAGRLWHTSLQLHMDVAGDAEASKRLARYLYHMVPCSVVKVPFTPQAPQCFLIARELEREGIPVNFTSTFSARQAVAAGLLADVTLTNVFMGRLNQGLNATLLGEHVALETQRALERARRRVRIKTSLIVASIREWQTFVSLAGCDAFTAPPDVIRSFLSQKDVTAADISSRREVSYRDRLRVGDGIGMDQVERLYRLEPELLEFLTAFRSSSDYQHLRDGDQLFKRFDQAGFGDLFYAPTAPERQELRKSKLPDMSSPLTARLPLDTLYSLLADADFEKHQNEMDQLIHESVAAELLDGAAILPRQGMA